MLQPFTEFVVQHSSSMSLMNASIINTSSKLMVHNQDAFLNPKMVIQKWILATCILWPFPIVPHYIIQSFVVTSGNVSYRILSVTCTFLFFLPRGILERAPTMGGTFKPVPQPRLEVPAQTERHRFSQQRRLPCDSN